MLQPYLEQLEKACAGHGLTLEEVCRAEGVADTTLARWRKGESTCREGTAKALLARLDKMHIEASMQEAL